MGLGSGIRKNLFRIPHPRSKRHRLPYPYPQRWRQLTLSTLYFFLRIFLSNLAPISSWVLCVPGWAARNSATHRFFSLFSFISVFCCSSDVITSSQSNLLRFPSGSPLSSSPSSSSSSLSGLEKTRVFLKTQPSGVFCVFYFCFFLFLFLFFFYVFA
jgi:hypothetical protein